MGDFTRIKKSALFHLLHDSLRQNTVVYSINGFITVVENFYSKVP
jgi:hypothetical protein